MGRLTGIRDECPVFEARIDLVRNRPVLVRDDDSSISAEDGLGVAGQAQHGPAADRVPESQSVLPAITGQQRPGGVEDGVQTYVDVTLEGLPPSTRRGVPDGDLS